MNIASNLLLVPAFQVSGAAVAKILSEMGIKTDIYVFPYSYEPFLSHTILKRNGFRYTFAGKDSKRIPIEELAR